MCALGHATEHAEKRLLVRTDSWMPYNGEPNSDKPGYAIEVLKAIFEPEGTTIDYQLMPYTEALDAAREGKVDAVIGADEVEGKGLTIPKLAIGEPSICLLTLAKEDLVYQSLRSLRGEKLGVIKGYAYWEALNSYIAKNVDIVSEEGDTPLTLLFAKLEAGEIKVLAESEPVLLWYLRENKKDRNNYKAVYRHMADPIFIVFSNDEKGKANSALFDKGMKALRESGELTKILLRYGMRDWK